MNQKIRFGIIGTNKITEQFIEAASLCEAFELSAIYSRTEERAQEFAKKYNAKHLFTDLEELLRSDVVDAMYIASPNALHAEQTRLCLSYKKHVLCEKPFASNKREVESMINSAKENNVVLMEAMKSTLLPNFKVIAKHLHKIGPVRRYFASFCQYSSRYDAYRDGVVLNAFNKELSNGALVDIGVYTIAPMIAWFGKPIEIQASAYFLESGVDGEGSIIFTYPNMQGMVMYSKISNSYVPSEIQGEEGSIVIHRINQMNQVTIYYRNGMVEQIAVPQLEQNMKYEVEEFISLILNDKKESDINSLQFSYEVMAVLDQVRDQIGLVYPADLKDVDE